MWTLLLFALLASVVALAVVLYVRYPRRGESVPHAPWLGDVLKVTVESLPTVGKRH